MLFKAWEEGQRGPAHKKRHFPHINLDKYACSGKQRWTGKLIWKRMHMFVLPRWRDATWKAGLLALGTPLMAPDCVYNVCRQFLSCKASRGLAGPKDPRSWWHKHLRRLLGKGQFNCLSSLSLPSLLDPLGDSHHNHLQNNIYRIGSFEGLNVISVYEFNVEFST